MDVQLSTRTMLELIDLLTTVATSAGIGDDDRYELAFARGQVATRMPAVELLVCAGLLWEASDRLALDRVLEGQPVPEPHRPSMGCSLKWKRGNQPSWLLGSG